MKKLYSLISLAILCCAVPALAQSPQQPRTSMNVTVSWTASTSSGIAAYNVYDAPVAALPCPTAPASFNLFGQAAPTATSLTVQNVPTGKVHCFVVTAVNASGIESVLSNEISLDMTQPTAPVLKSATAQ